ncbi:MAG: hypothetical protein JWM11_6472 [Planctomycetaceae bacterium]|nr:hypothetical protein [Planctomycetaceae bacterium]
MSLFQYVSPRSNVSFLTVCGTFLKADKQPDFSVGDVSPRLAVEEVCRSGKLFDVPVVWQVLNRPRYRWSEFVLTV